MKRIKPILVVLVTMLFMIVSSFPYAPTALALCSGTACNGTWPSTTGCSATATPVKVAYPGSAEISIRKSTACNTYWARTQNIVGGSYYGNATFWYQENGTVKYYTLSGSSITLNLSVFTQQRYYPSLVPGLLSCGRLSTGSLTGPLGTPCTAQTGT